VVEERWPASARQVEERVMGGGDCGQREADTGPKAVGAGRRGSDSGRGVERGLTGGPRAIVPVGRVKRRSINLKSI
jgi:hypothetical protein